MKKAQSALLATAKIAHIKFGPISTIRLLGRPQLALLAARCARDLRRQQPFNFSVQLLLAAAPLFRRALLQFLQLRVRADRHLDLVLAHCSPSFASAVHMLATRNAIVQCRSTVGAQLDKGCTVRYPCRAEVVDVPALTRLRNRASLSQRELAKLSGVAASTIARIEAGHKAHPKTVRMLAEALKCAPTELTGLDK
jgi:DNA-binding XRE family transcriptional regulator